MNSKQNAPIDTIPEQYRNNMAQSNKFCKFFTVPKASKEKGFYTPFQWSCTSSTVPSLEQ